MFLEMYGPQDFGLEVVLRGVFGFAFVARLLGFVFGFVLCAVFFFSAEVFCLAAVSILRLAAASAAIFSSTRRVKSSSV